MSLFAILTSIGFVSLWILTLVLGLSLLAVFFPRLASSMRGGVSFLTGVFGTVGPYRYLVPHGLGVPLSAQSLGGSSTSYSGPVWLDLPSWG